MPPDKFDEPVLNFLHSHNNELMVLIFFVLVVLALVILVPQLLRSSLRKAELIHKEHLAAVDKGQLLPAQDDAVALAGRTAMLVPMVVVICAGTVTCFLVAYKSEQVFAVSLAVWTVAGVVSLAAITGGVALIGRLAQLEAGEKDEDLPANPLEG